MSMVEVRTPQVKEFFAGRKRGHTSWCARDQRCGLDEHRSDPVVIDSDLGRVVVVRVLSGQREHAEVRASVSLPGDREAAELALTSLLLSVKDLLDSQA